MKDDMKPRAPETSAGAELLSFCNNAALRKAARGLGKLYDAVLEPSGLKATQFSLLTQIYDLGNPTMAELANSLVMDLSAMRHSLGPLIRDGYGPASRRSKGSPGQAGGSDPRRGREIQGSHAALAKGAGAF